VFLLSRCLFWQNTLALSKCCFSASLSFSKTPPSIGGSRAVAELTCESQFDYCEYDIVYNMILVFYSYQFYDQNMILYTI
jgi:hypothetical protein